MSFVSPSESSFLPLNTDGSRLGPISEIGKLSLMQPTSFIYATPMSKNHKSWPFVVVFISSLIASFGYIFSQLPEYRFHIRYQLFAIMGTKFESGEWVGGHREIAEFMFLFLSIGLPTLVAGVALSYADALPPVPKGVYRTFVRFLKKKIWAEYLTATYSEIFWFTFFFAMNAIWFAANYADRIKKVEETGDKIDSKARWQMLGYVLGFNAVLCFSVLIIPATRNCFWMISMGVDYSHGIKYHRWIGIFTIFMVLCHALPYYKQWLAAGTFMKSSFPCFDCEVEESKRRLQNFSGQLALLCCLIIGLTSLPVVRRNYYSFFYCAHHLAIVVVICGVLHFSSFVMWMYPAVCLYAIHRILAFSQSRVAAEVVEMEAVPGEVTRLVFRRSPGKAGHYHAGQFVYLRIPVLSKAQWHPFTISSSPIEYEDTFTVHVKAVGKWTKSLYGLAIQVREERKVPLVYVDGFYGKMSDDFQHYPVLLLVAGGIGATPVISILGKILDCFRNNDPAFEKTQVYFQWTSREIGIFHEFEPLLDAIEEFDPNHTRIRVRLCFTGDQHLGGVNIPTGITLKPLDDTSGIPTRPFYQSSRSVSRQVCLFIVTFLASFISLIMTRYNYPLLGTNREKQGRWPLQRLMELVMMLVGASAAWIVAVTEPKPRSVSRVDKNKFATQYTESCKRSDFGDRHPTSCYSQTLSFEGEDIQFKHPVCRSRLNIRESLADVVKEQSHNHQLQETGIGLWVSGPMGLIHNVETEAARYAGIYDVHYEEFQM